MNSLRCVGGPLDGRVVSVAGDRLYVKLPSTYALSADAGNGNARNIEYPIGVYWIRNVDGETVLSYAGRRK